MTWRRPGARGLLPPLAVLVGLVGLTACGPESRPDATPTSPAASADPTGSSTVDSVIPNGSVFRLTVAPGPKLGNAGTAELSVTTEALDSGLVSATEGPDGRPAADFPPFVTAGTYPRAALRVDNAGSSDELSPGDRDFSWGASFRLDAVSAGNPVDNGDNLVQRGLSSQPAMFKAELDLRRPGCTVRGAEGELIVRADLVAETATWYAVRCERVAERLTVRVWEYRDGEPVEVEEKSVEGPVGPVAFAPATLPLAVGGKLGSDGRLIKSATDQFNGRVSGAFLSFDD